MPKSQYKFNPEDLNYRQMDNKLSRRVWKVLVYIVAILVVAILLNVLYSLFFDTPRERQIRKENELLEEQYQSLAERKHMVDTVMNDIQRIDRDIYRVIFETEPVEADGPKVHLTNFHELWTASNEDIVYASAGKSDSLMQHVHATSPSYDRLLIKGSQKEDMLLCLPAIQPIDNPDLSLVASGFGHRIHPIYKIMKMHEGIDFSAPVGTPIKATGNGVVEQVIRSGRGLGNRIIISHGFGYHSMYACMDEIQTRRGRQVERGDVIGTVGESGLTVAPHLHYEVHLNGSPVNPINYFFLELDPLDYDRLILTSLMSGQSFD